MKLASLSTMSVALGVSIAIHASLLVLRTVNPEAFNRIMDEQPLEVVLVNASSKDRPREKPQVMAQANLNGGGEADSGRATSPLPVSAFTQLADDSADEERQQIQNLQQQQQKLLTQVKAQIAALSQPESPQSDLSDQREREERRKQLIKALAEIERAINIENARPRKSFVSPSAIGSPKALYYDHVRRIIEAKGTSDFPVSGGHKLYGELTMVVTVDFNGKVVETDVVQGSGNPTLDRQAQAIVRASGPFKPFDKTLRSTAEQLVMVARFNFTKNEALQTSVSSIGQ